MSRRAIRFFVALAAAAISVFCCACSENYEYEYFEKDRSVFSGSMALYAKLLGKNAPEAYDEMVERVERLGSEITLTDGDSALSYFNEKAEAGEKVEVSKETYDLISLALGYEKETDGAFSIGMLGLTELWKVDAASLGGEESSELPDIDEVRRAATHCDTSALTLTSDGGAYYLEKSDAELKIDLGGIAKGYCADICVEVMKKHSLSSALVNISGNIVLFGKYYDGRKYTDWEIGVIDPRPKNAVLHEQICCINGGGDESVVTSGDYRRFRTAAGGLQLCHIIDPESGLPSDIEYDGGYKKKKEVVSSATAICSSSARADAYSTAFAVMGIDRAAEFLKLRSDADALIFSELGTDGGAEERGRMLATAGVEFIRTDEFGGYKRYEPFAERV